MLPQIDISEFRYFYFEVEIHDEYIFSAGFSPMGVLPHLNSRIDFTMMQKGFDEIDGTEVLNVKEEYSVESNSGVDDEHLFHHYISIAKANHLSQLAAYPCDAYTDHPIYSPHAPKVILAI